MRLLSYTLLLLSTDSILPVFLSTLADFSLLWIVWSWPDDETVFAAAEQLGVVTSFQTASLECDQVNGGVGQNEDEVCGTPRSDTA